MAVLIGYMLALLSGLVPILLIVYSGAPGNSAQGTQKLFVEF